jgi:hypothetical protein
LIFDSTSRKMIGTMSSFATMLPSTFSTSHT